LVEAYGGLTTIVPLFDTTPELLEFCVVVTVVALLLPTTVVVTIFCDPIAVIDIPGPPLKRNPSLAAFT
jgi:hypothetical protein